MFGDNHDMDRIYTQLNKDLVLTKMALSCILMLPRIPQVYYGTELLLDNSDNPGGHGLIRTDFPGGWRGDNINGFTGIGLTSEQIEMQSFMRKVLSYRKNSKAIHKGNTVHFAPDNGVYVLFRILDEEVVTLILNKNESTSLDLSKYEEIGLYGKTMKNIISGEELVWNDILILESKGLTILTTKK